jgi:hypothetical protein
MKIFLILIIVSIFFHLSLSFTFDELEQIIEESKNKIKTSSILVILNKLKLKKYFMIYNY